MGAVRVRAAASAGMGNGHHPSADSTARRMARRLLPPIHSGGLGRCAGRGSMVLPGAWKAVPSKVTLSPDHAASMAASASSIRSLRSAKGTPSASNSGSR